MIQVQDLCISFNGKVLLNNICFSVRESEIFSLTGDSGRGKSSIFSALMGFLRPHSGKITINNLQVNHENIHAIRDMIAWLPQNLNSLPNLPVNSQIQLLKSFKKNHHNFEIDKFSEFIEIFRLRNDILNAHYSELSGGEKQRLALIYALLQKKPILLLDEPTSALDDTSEQAVTDYLKSRNDLTILASSHSDYWMSQSDNSLRI